MKKRLFCVLLGLILLFTYGCGQVENTSGSSSVTAPSASTGPSSGSTANTTPTITRPTVPYTTIPPQERGSVRIYTCDAALYEIYLEIAAEYMQKNGVEVTVVLGQGDCRQALETEMGKQEAPTMLCLHSQADLEHWQGSLYDLAGAAVVSELYSLDFVKRVEDRILAVAADVKGFGLIYNASLLAQAGFTRSDIVDFAYLELVCQRITKEKPGFSAFSGLDFSDSAHRGTACMLSGIAGEAEHLKNFLSLYLAHDKTSSDPLQQFLSEKSLFYIGGTWDYGAVAPLGDHKLDILPAFCSHGGSLRCTTELCWAVNKNAGARDIRQTLDFMRWLVMAPKDEAAPVDRLGLLSPYRGAAFYANKLEEKLRGYMASEPVSVEWGCCPSLQDGQLQQLSQALSAYTKSPTQENWAAVEKILAGTLSDA